jgi:hypothetical protein
MLSPADYSLLIQKEPFRWNDTEWGAQIEEDLRNKMEKIRDDLYETSSEYVDFHNDITDDSPKSVLDQALPTAQGMEEQAILRNQMELEGSK